jgi:TetR/AcrR family transcriptional regulator, cholesterol catabolism regulator
MPPPPHLHPKLQPDSIAPQFPLSPGFPQPGTLAHDQLQHAREPLSRSVEGLRAQRKAETRARVRDAAWQLFTTQGFDATTTKEIAEQAGIATGTVFVHARDKNDLLMLAMHDRLAETTGAALATLNPELSFIDNLLPVFHALYCMYGEHPELSAAFIRANLGADGPHAAALNSLTLAFLERLATLVRFAQERHEVRPEIAAQHAATHLFSLYYAGLVACIHGYAPWKHAAATLLRPQLELLMQGLRESGKMRR